MEYLAYLVNREFSNFSRARGKKAIGSDLDGTFTDYRTPKIYNLLLSNFKDRLHRISPELEERLSGLDFNMLWANSRFPFGWHTDTQTGLFVLINGNNEIIEVRKGIEKLSQNDVHCLYGSRITQSTNLDPDRQKPRFLPRGDGFDIIEGLINATIACMYLPQSDVNAIGSAWFDTHNAPDGYRSQILLDPKRYGIKENPELKSLFMDLRNSGYLPFVVTSSPNDFAMKILDALGMIDCFDEDMIIAGARKPMCFVAEHSNFILNRLRSRGITDVANILFGGDNLYKDVVPVKELGFFTYCRSPRFEIEEITRKLKKYASVRFQDDSQSQGKFCIAEQTQAVDSKNLGKYLYDTFKFADVITTKVQNLRNLLINHVIPQAYPLLPQPSHL